MNLPSKEMLVLKVPLPFRAKSKSSLYYYFDFQGNLPIKGLYRPLYYILVTLS